MEIRTYYFFFFWSLLLSLCMVFNTVSCNIDEVLLINPFANVFVFGDLNIHHDDLLTYSGATDRPGELCYNFSISKGLIHMVNFPTRIPNFDFLLTIVFVLQLLSLHWEILIMLLYQFPLAFLQTEKGMTLLITQLMTTLFFYKQLPK